MIYAAFMINNDRAPSLTVREAVKEQRREAYALLSALYRRIFDSEAPRIARSESGKPYFIEDGAPEFNISHSEGGYLVAISTDKRPIGVDIQIEKSEELARRICARFPFVSTVSDSTPIDGISVLIAKRCQDGFSFSDYAPQGHACDGSFFSKWALCEAILKAEGGGFRSAGRLGDLSDIKTLSFKHLSFYMSIASY